MKVALLGPSPVPFTSGGAEGAWRGIYESLAALPAVEIELLKLPSPERTLHEVMTSYAAWSRLDVRHFDLVITGKYPAWMVTHPAKTVYMLHPLRGLYDTYPTGLTEARKRPPAVRATLDAAEALDRGGHPEGVFAAFDAALADLGLDHPSFAFPGPLARRLVTALDSWALAPGRTRRWLSISRTVSQRPGYFPKGVPVEVLLLPSHLQGLIGSERQDHFFTASRLDHPKRIDMIIEAYRMYEGDVPLLIAGIGPEEQRLKRVAGADPRIRFLGRLSEAELREHYASALSVIFVPKDEDLGLITIEAMASGKPVITTNDSGGPTEFTIDGITGLVTEPRPQALATALKRLDNNREFARALGHAGRGRARELDWGHVAAELLKPASARQRRLPSVGRRSPRPRLLLASTYRVDQPRSGGPLRVHHLARALSATYDVDVLSLVSSQDRRAKVAFAPGCTQHVEPRSVAHDAENARLSGAAHANVEDITAGVSADFSPRFLDRLDLLAAGASGIVLCQPYLLPALAGVLDLPPLIHDSHNVEYLLKADILRESPVRERLLRVVRAIEEQALLGSALTTVASADEVEVFVREFGTSAHLPVVPNGVDLGRTFFTGPIIRRENSSRLRQRLGGGAAFTSEPAATALFVGSWHEPNIEAALSIVQWAIDLPQISFILAGSVGNAVRQRAAVVPDNVHVPGPIPDSALTTLLASCDVALNPMTSGAGTNLKMVEYLAAGIPVVSTEFGARGLGADDRHARMVGIPDFPDALQEVTRQPYDDDRLARGRALAEQFSWDLVGRRFHDEVARTLETPAVRGAELRDRVSS